MDQTKTILIAGGTGLIGQELAQLLKSKGHRVKIVTRQNRKEADYFFWNPLTNEIEEEALTDIQVIVNLCGAPIAGKRWTTHYKKELVDSRIKTTQFLFDLSPKLPQLEQYVSASGITCYGFLDNTKVYKETDDFGQDFLSQIVQQWETSADLFSTTCKVAKLRTGIVLSQKGGALPVMAKSVRYYFGASFGSGKQIMPWLTLRDIARLYTFVIERQLKGVFNAASSEISNTQLTHALAQEFKKPLWLPKVPSFLLKLLLGEMSVAVLKGIHIDNSKVKESGFSFQHQTIEEAFDFIYNKNEKD